VKLGLTPTDLECIPDEIPVFFVDGDQVTVRASNKEEGE
jgi:hypothetical protein